VDAAKILLERSGFSDVRRVGDNLYSARLGGKEVYVLLKERRDGGFTIRKSRLEELEKLGEVYVLLLRWRVLPLAEAVKRKLLKVYSPPHLPRRRGARVRISLSVRRDTLELIDKTRGDMSRSRFVERTLRLWLGAGDWEV